MPEKTHMISVRLTDAERRKLSQICAVSGLPVSAAIREMIGGVTIRQRPPQELHDLYVEINRIGKMCIRDRSFTGERWNGAVSIPRSTREKSPPM